jgi:hypothetical protein
LNFLIENFELSSNYEMFHKIDAYEKARRYTIPREEIEERVKAAGYLGLSDFVFVGQRRQRAK